MTGELYNVRALDGDLAHDGYSLVTVGGVPMWLPAVRSVVAGTNVTVDNTDPLHPIVSASSGVGGVASVVAGTNVTVDNTDPANPIVSASGGGSSSPYPLDPASLHATYGDHFTGSSLNTSKWTRVGYVAGDEQYQQGGGTWLQIDTARAAGNYYWQAAPSGNFTVVMKLQLLAPTGVMFGPMITDSSGNGVQSAFYYNSDGHWVLGCTAAAYNSTSAAVVAPTYVVGSSATNMWLKLNKNGTAYKASISLNGSTWRKWTSTITFATTPTRIGWGSILGTPVSFAVDWFDVQ